MEHYEKKLLKWFPLLYLAVSMVWNLYISHSNSVGSESFDNAESALFALLIAGLVVFLPLVVLLFIIVSGSENLKYSLFAALWIWLIAYMIIYRLFEEDKPCMYGGMYWG